MRACWCLRSSGKLPGSVISASPTTAATAAHEIPATDTMCRIRAPAAQSIAKIAGANSIAMPRSGCSVMSAAGTKAMSAGGTSPSSVRWLSRNRR